MKIEKTSFVALTTLVITGIAGCGEKASPAGEASGSAKASTAASAKAASSAAPAGSGAAATNSPPQGGSSKCGPKEFGDPDGVFCITLPADYTPGEKKMEGEDNPIANYWNLNKKDPDQPGIHASYRLDEKGLDYANYADVSHYGAQDGVEYEEKGTTADGKGTFRQFLQTKEKMDHCEAHVRSGKYHVMVQITSRPDKKLTAEALQSCKSVHAP